MNIYDFEVVDNAGNKVSLDQYKGKVIMVVNTATECGFTPQYQLLEEMYEKYKDQGFVILDFPCNQFGQQAPGSNADIFKFCSSRFGVSFPIFSKIEVNGENAAPLYQYLVKQKGFGGFQMDNELAPILEDIISKTNPNFKNEPDIKWNFTKFLIDKDGTVVERFEPTMNMKTVEDKVKSLL